MPLLPWRCHGAVLVRRAAADVARATQQLVVTLVWCVAHRVVCSTHTPSAATAAPQQHPRQFRLWITLYSRKGLPDAGSTLPCPSGPLSPTFEQRFPIPAFDDMRIPYFILQESNVNRMIAGRHAVLQNGTLYTAMLDNRQCVWFIGATKAFFRRCFPKRYMKKRRLNLFDENQINAFLHTKHQPWKEKKAVENIQPPPLLFRMVS